MKKNILASAAFCFIATISLAQSTQNEALFGRQYSSNLTQQSFNSLLSTQSTIGKAGSEAIVIQTGSGNTQNLTTKGSGNHLVASQVGDENTINMDLAGNNNQYMLQQHGSGNTLQMNKIVSNGISFQVGQSQDGNSLTLEGSKIGSLQSMKIEQTGGMKLIVESNPIFLK
jgi:hypothetical protein